MKSTVLAILTLFSSISIIGQNISGSWQETKESGSGVEIRIHKVDSSYLGHFLKEPNYWSNAIITPLDSIYVKNDSLFLFWTSRKKQVSCELKWQEESGTYEGFIISGSRQAKPIVFSRKPISKEQVISPKTKTIATKQDSLRGMVTPERVWWDLTYYHLEVKVNPEKKTISGKNTIQYRVLQTQNVMQIDLQPPLKLTKAIQNGKQLEIVHEGNAHFIALEEEQKVGEMNAVEVYYSGTPTEAVNAPWDGGFSWKKDKNGNHFIATSCQGIGASVWWPNKDHMYDEVDSMLISVTNPKGLTNISNGRLRKLENNLNSTITSHWFVGNPINNYGVNVNIGDYVHFSEVYQGEKGNLDMDYYVLRDNLEKAKKQFTDAPKMMEAFEHWFGPYPFYKDGYKLVEVPYLGMEHQSSVTYGNNYNNGYLGRDLSGTGWGLKFDFIIIHESGHEWFANNITYKDIADMWVHESFTNYSENLFLDYHYGKTASAEYVIGTRKGIRNDKPIIGEYGINRRGSGDMYSKGGYMLHTLRQIIEDDEKWRNILRGLNQVFYHKTVEGIQIEDYISEKSGMNLKSFFNQYLRTTKIPILEVYHNDKMLTYRWINAVEGFDMPLKVFINNVETWIYPKVSWSNQLVEGQINKIVLDPNFYVGELRYTDLKELKMKK